MPGGGNPGGGNPGVTKPVIAADDTGGGTGCGGQVPDACKAGVCIDGS